ncbi:MAG: M24 family metallopeptidase [Candidatus Gastranaerophilaceae bacterium]|jgi:Xaa-Pro aminopeptidase
MNFLENLQKFREFMNKEGLAFFIVNSTDEYLNEYNSLEKNSRYILSGFTGSTGEMLISSDKAFLFVDGRYHKQADEEVDNNLITVVKLQLNQSQRDGIVDILKQNFLKNQKLGIVSSKTGFQFYTKLKEDLSALSVEFVEYTKDPIYDIIPVATEDKSYLLRTLPADISGVSTKEKLNKLAQKLEKTDVLIITKLEEIAYITNLRSNQILFSSSFKAKAVFDRHNLFIFCDTSFINDEIRTFSGENVIFLPENDFENFILKNYKDKNLSMGLIPSFINLETYTCIEETANTIVNIEESPISSMKCIKNDREIEHISDCFKKSDKVVNKTIKWLNDKIEKNEKISEKDLSDKVKDFFKKEKAHGLSFEVLLSSAKNTAIVHYTHSNPQKYIKKGELVLLDCGGYYEGGYATDITRTFLAGKDAKANNLQKKVYTTVLKAFLNAYNIDIDENTTGFDIDKKARNIIEESKIEGFTFSHGTGHGVGISVHEYPPAISPGELSKKPVKEGMCFTIEPGLYNDNWGGVRLENTVFLTEINGKLKLKTLSQVPFDEKLIDFDLLNNDEKKWLAEF